MPGGREDLMLLQHSRIARDVDPGDVGDIIAILFQPIDRGVFGAKQKVLPPSICADAVARAERPVITYLIGATGSRIPAGAIATVQIGTAPAIVGLPSGVRRLEHDGAR